MLFWVDVLRNMQRQVSSSANCAEYRRGSTGARVVVDVPLKCSDKFQHFPASEVPQISSSTEFQDDPEADFDGFLVIYRTPLVGVESRLSADCLSPRWPTVVGRRGLGGGGDAKSLTPRCSATWFSTYFTAFFGRTLSLAQLMLRGC